MNRAVLGTLLAATLVAAFSGCDDGLSGSFVGPAADCSAYRSCDTCTPVLGCGWCTGPGGAGVCASDPDYCPTQEFSWTWDMSGCRIAADASVSAADDAGAPEGSADGAATRPDGNTDGAHVTNDASSD